MLNLGWRFMQDDAKGCSVFFPVSFFDSLFAYSYLPHVIDLIITRKIANRSPDLVKCSINLEISQDFRLSCFLSNYCRSVVL